MKGKLLSLAAATALLATTACSSGKYFLFNNASSSSHRAAPVATATLPAPGTEAAAPVVADLTTTAALEAAPAPAPATVAAAAAEARAAVRTLPAAQQAQLEKKITKLAHKLEKRAAKQAASPASPLAEGKSQIIALVLVVLLGGLGIHRFYLGYTGIGIAQLLTLGGCGIWALIDLIRIITGDLKPKDGDYAEKL